MSFITDIEGDRIGTTHKGTDMRNSFYMDRLNRTVVPADLLAEVIQKYTALPAAVDGEAFGQRSECLNEILRRRGAEDTLALKIAIDLRVAALEQLPAEALQGWSTPGNVSGPDFVHPDLVRAAAEEPLIEDGTKQQRLVFDTEGFRRRLLEITGTEGLT
jgi:hypothetical protein